MSLWKPLVFILRELYGFQRIFSQYSAVYILSTVHCVQWYIVKLGLCRGTLQCTACMQGQCSACMQGQCSACMQGQCSALPTCKGLHVYNSLDISEGVRE